MVEAYRGQIICPNKQNDPLESFYEGHLVESETYIGMNYIVFKYHCI